MNEDVLFNFIDFFNQIFEEFYIFLNAVIKVLLFDASLSGVLLISLSNTSISKQRSSWYISISKFLETYHKDYCLKKVLLKNGLVGDLQLHSTRTNK